MGDFTVGNNLLLAYDEYCVDCLNEGIEPLPFCEWLWGQNS